MKKSFVFILMILCMFLLAYAEMTIIVKDTVQPDIKATFNETVILAGYNLTYAVDGTNIVLDNSTSDNKVFVFKPVQNLNNGFYYFVVNARDRIGNAKVFRENVIIFVNETKIYFVKPLLGYASTEVYNITIGTSLPSNCSWSFQDDSYADSRPFTEKNSITHTLLNFRDGVSVDGDNQESYQSLFIKCIDRNKRLVDNELKTGYDTTPPVITRLRASSNPVNRIPPTTTITADVSDKSVCYISGPGITNKIFDGQNQDDVDSYSVHPSYTIRYPYNDTRSNGNFTYSVSCINRPQQTTKSPSKISIAVGLEAALRITSINSPKSFISSSPVTYDVLSNKAGAVCTATLNPGNIVTPLAVQQDGYEFKAIGPAVQTNKTYITKFTCTKGSEKINRSVSFVLDTSVPSNFTIGAAACSIQKIVLAFSAVDKESNIYGYNYSISGRNLAINTTTTTSPNVVIEKLNLNKTLQYVVSASAINGAGLPTPILTKTFVVNPNATECLEKVPPELTLSVNDTSTGKKVTVVCYDKDSGCSNSSIKIASNVNKTNCVPFISGTSTTVTSSAWVCASAQDNAGNKANVTQLISLVALASTCSDGIKDGTESDIDCGGNCLSCQIGKSCSLNADCAGNYCFMNKCTQSLCTDGIKNGFESDVDCGGGTCQRCSINKSCASNSDCGSNNCERNGTVSVCKPTSCSDGKKNGFESDVDCGGASCTKCAGGKGCTANTDCISGSCQFGSCLTTGIEAVVPELQAPSNVQSYILLAIAIMLLAAGVLLMYYFKSDKMLAINVLLIGGAALIFAIFDLFIVAMPSYVTIIIALAALGSGGFFVYKSGILTQPKKNVISKVQTAQVQKQTAAPQTAIPEKPTTKEEMEATKVMMEMLKKQKAEREQKREAVFEKFGRELKKEKPSEKIGKNALLPIKKESIITNPITRPIPKNKTEFEKLSEISKNARPTSELGKFSSEEGAFEKLGKFAKSGYESVFGKLPGKEKDVKQLSELEKKNLMKKLKGLKK